MADKDEKPTLQRRGGRRISIPSSPISPSLPKRNDRFFRPSDPNRATEIPLTVDTYFEQPSIDLTIPSPVFDGLNFATSHGEDDEPRVRGGNPMIMEEIERHKPLDLKDDLRGMPPSTRKPETRPAPSLRPSYLPDLNTRSSPIMGRSSEGRDRNFEMPVSSSRNYSTTSLSTDRSASDENVTSKTQGPKTSRLNLFKSMGLLARRRSSQNAKLEDINVNASPFHVPAIPDNFDPSIRGNIVHDFSTPRNKRSHFENSPHRESFSSPANLRRPSDFGTPGGLHANSPSPALHSPMFKENFQDDENALQPGQTGYLHNITTSRKLFDAPSPATLPSFAQRLPTILPEPEDIDSLTSTPPLNIPHPDLPPPLPPKSAKRTPSPHLDIPAISTLPKHMTSVSSRFSFQIAGQDSSTQEKLLEERHKEHFAKEANNGDVAEEQTPNDYDDYDFDASDDFEEQIPGVNTDFGEEDDFYNDDIPIRNINVQSSQQMQNGPVQSLHDFHFTPTNATFSPTDSHDVSILTPRDVEGFAIGVASSKDSPANPVATYPQHKPAEELGLPLFLEGLRISTVDQTPSLREDLTPSSDPTQRAFDDGELYFDDGEFDIDQVENDATFDESLLDDESTQIRDIPAENAKKYEEAVKRSAPGDRITVVNSNPSGISRDTSSSSNYAYPYQDTSSSYSESRAPELDSTDAIRTSVLTENNLAAYHDALAEATNIAAANGKFNRQVSFRSLTSEETDQSQNDSGGNFGVQSSVPQHAGSSACFDDDGTFAFDDDGMDDDLMIAEANAEALENDDDGFYGQEFGFYARARGKDNSELTNGGFFAARGSNGIKRSHSGKANFQEPSLTPITERSEWSTRNSVASLTFPGGLPAGSQPIPSPGITELLRSPAFEDEMTLTALMKLRRNAFGGSSTSVNSLGERSMPGSSPLAHVSSYSFPPPESTYKRDDGISGGILESEEEEDGEGEQLTLTQNTPRKKVPGASPPKLYTQMAHLAVTKPNYTNRRSHHRRNSSGADSVSYVQDQDGHWVLERRRTGDDGEQEIIEREYLPGGQI